MTRTTTALLALAVSAGSALAQPAAAPAPPKRPAVGSSARAPATPALAALVERFPAPDAPTRDALCAEILRLGPRRLAAVLTLVQPPGKGDDSKARFAVNGLADYAARPGARADRAAVARALVAALGRTTDADVAQFFISQLQLVGRQESVLPLQRYLADERLAGPAAAALLAIDTPGVTPALLAALGRAPETVRPVLIDALGQRRSREAVPRLLTLAESRDAATRLAARAALANVGDPAAADALARVRLDAPGRERAEAPALYMLFARRLAENGHRERALAAARSILAGYVRPDEGQHAAAALALVHSIEGERALPDLIAAMDHPVASVRGAALNLADTIPGPEATARWVEKAADANPEVRAAVVAMLGRRGDVTALPFVREGLRSPDEAVRVAAVGTAARLGKAGVLPELLPMLAKASAAESSALKAALVGYPAALVVPPALSLLDATPMPGKAALVEVLAEKGSRDAIEPVYRLAADEDPAVREAALAALVRLAREEDVPRLVAMLEKTTATDEAVRLREAIAAAVLRNPDPAALAAGLVDLLHRSPPAGKAVILRLAPRVGGDELLRAATAEAAGADGDVQSAAVSALSRWPEPGAGPELLRIAATLPKPEQGRLVANGYVRLLARTEELPPAARLAALEKVFGLPGDRVDGKALIAAVASVREPEALRLLGRGLAGEDVLRAAAATALVDFAAKQVPSEPWLSGHEAYSLLRRAEATLTDPAARERAAAVIADRLTRGGFVPLFDGRSLESWKGLVTDARVREHWRVEGGTLFFDGKGDSLGTRADYGDVELLVDWRIGKGGDSGIQLRGSPQVRIGDAEANPVGPGGLINDETGLAKPSERADRPVGEWNSFRIFVIGDRVTVYLNDRRVVDGVALEAGGTRAQRIPASGPIELKARGTPVAFRNVWVREIPRDTSTPSVTAAETAEGFVPLYNGRDLEGWTGNVAGYAAENGRIVVHPERAGGNLYTAREYADFVLRFEFKLTPAANNGLGVRAPLQGDAAYVGMELQILEDGSPLYWDLQAYQYHGSVYGVVPAKRGVLRPVGEWNTEEVTLKGRHVTVAVNGTTVVDADLDEASRGGTIDRKDHPGLQRASGHVGFLGHGSIVELRNVRIRELR